MANRLKQIQPVFTYAANHLDEDVSLAALARQLGLSPFHFHRLFSSLAGETPKELTLRLRLDRAAVLLLASDQSVLDVALSCGFQSHEAFCRAFRRRFSISPGQYRRRGFLNAANVSQAEDHARFVSAVGPCIGLYHITESGRLPIDLMSYTITKVQLAQQPVIVGRRRVKRSDIAATIGLVLSNVFQFAQQRGIALTGLPFTRYVEVGPGLMTIEPGMRIANSGQAPLQIDPSWLTGNGEAEVRADTLPGGTAAFTTHIGGYDKLSDAYAAIEQWIEEQGASAAGPPWESYVTDPSEYPDQKDWKTEVFWPIQAQSQSG